ncbi:MAG: transglutaminase-like domain-containing protein [Verrucomicrobiales bacterium]|nr:transglutaminase-like domain-containing protein [Verrucomicrobiales bacterium]
MDFDKLESPPGRESLQDRARAHLEGRHYRLGPATEALNRALPIPVEFQADLKGQRFVVKCVDDTLDIGEAKFRALVDFCSNHHVKVMMVSERGVPADLAAIAEVLSVQIITLAQKPPPLPPKETSLFSTSHLAPVGQPKSNQVSLPPLSVPPSASLKRRSRRRPFYLSFAIFLACAAVIGWSAHSVYKKVKHNQMVMQENERIKTLSPANVTEQLRAGIAEARSISGLSSPIFDQNNFARMIPPRGAMPKEKTLKEIQVLANPGFRLGASTLLKAPDLDSLLSQVKAWPPLKDPATDVQFGHVTALEQEGNLWAWVYTGKTLSRSQQLDEALTGGGIFSLRCSHCEKDSTFEISAHATHLVSPICSHCGLATHLFGPDTEGDYRRACNFLTGFKLPESSIDKHRPPEGCTPKQDVMAHWKAILDRCDYEYDSSVDRDVWKLPSQTWEERVGDCEDTSILLTDALISSGYEARVAFGHWQGEGHAWCVVKVEGRQYILETTQIHTGAAGMRRIIKVGGEYVARGTFDRDSIYLRRNAANMSTLDYFSDNYWLKMDVKSNEDSPLPHGQFGLQPEQPTSRKQASL